MEVLFSKIKGLHTFLLNFTCSHPSCYRSIQDRVKGIGAEIHLTVEQGKVVDAEIIDSGREYEAVEVVAPTMTGDHAVFSDISLESGSIRTVEVIHGGSGYINDFTPKLVPNFSRSTLWAFWIIDTLCCILFLINFFFELRLSDSKKWY